MISINTNLSSFITQSNLAQSTLGLNQAIERMTTGFKINHAKDNAANYSISTNLSTKIGAYRIAEDNVSSGLNLLTTANESLNLINNGLSRLRALQEQASNGTYGTQSLSAINSEANAILDEIQRTYSTTSFNGIHLFDGLTNLKNASTRAMARAGGTQPPQAGANGFIAEVDKDDPQVVVTDPTKLAEAIDNNSIIGISNAETLAELATIVNSGNDCSGKTIVLTNDIDLGSWCADHADEGGWTPIGYYISSAYEDSNGDYVEIEEGIFFDGTFNGNGYTISNLYINKNEDYFNNYLHDNYDDVVTVDYFYIIQGLFGYMGSASEIKNIGLKDEDITAIGSCMVGGLVGWAYGTITNSYSTGDVSGKNQVGGLVGWAYGTITNSYSTGDVSGKNYVGGLAGGANRTITNSYSTGAVSGIGQVGGLVGYYNVGNNYELTNCYTYSKVTGETNTGSFIGRTQKSGSSVLTISNCTYYSDLNPTLSAIGTNTANVDLTNLVDGGYPPIFVNIGLQVGINSGDSSRINVETSFILSNLDQLRNIGLNTTQDYLSMIDDILSTVSAKQTEYGSAQNRLESALEEISVQYENLVSSRSTIRDADIAQESSQYIKHQILQQASATLLATANQTPAIALQLI